MASAAATEHVRKVKPPVHTFSPRQLSGQGASLRPAVRQPSRELDRCLPESRRPTHTARTQHQDDMPAIMIHHAYIRSPALELI
eukprot:302234-Prymnesium_polylepis.1